MNKYNDSQIDREDDIFFLKPKTSNNKRNSITSASTNNDTTNTKNTISGLYEQEINQKEINEPNESKIKIENHKDNKNMLNQKEIELNQEVKQYIIYAFIKIDKTNKFILMTDQDDEIIEETLSSFKKTNKKINTIFIPFLNKICPNCDGDPINISKYFSKEIFKFQKMTKDLVENYLNYFFSLRYELLYSTHFLLSIKIIRYLGYILSYTYQKFHFYYIKDNKQFNAFAKKTLEIHEDALIDFYNSINELEGDENTEKNKKMHFWKKNRTKYLVPPEIIF